jgi:hypothetical protein
MNRGAAVAAVSLAVLVVATTAVGPALAAVAPADPARQVNESVEPGPFASDDLRRGGTQPSAAPPSVRYVGGDSVEGAVALRYKPADPLSNDPKYLKSGSELNTDEIEVYSTVFGDATGEYELVIVYWSPETRQTENGTAVDVAADQEVQRATINIEDGYASAPVALNSHYGESVETTAWLEKNGERVDGARWRFDHASAPASQQVTIDNRADAWWYAVRTAILPGLASIIVGLSAAKATLRRTGRGPGYSLGAWGIITGFGGVAILAGLYYEISTVVANIEVLLGLSLLPVAYGGGLRMSPPTETIAFERKELTDALTLRRGRETGADDSGDVIPDGGASATDAVELENYHDELYEDLALLTTVRAPDGGRLLPKTGIRPFFARLFASAAKLDLSALKTRVRVRGDASQKVYVDPEEEDALDHKPAGLRRRMPVWHRLPEPADGERLSSVTRALYGSLTLLTLGAPVIGWYAGAAAANVPTVGAAVGLLVLAVEGVEAVDGRIGFEPAARHDVTADASLTVLQKEHADAKTIEELEEVAWSERSRTALEAREVESRRESSIIQQLAEGELGMDLDALGFDDDLGDDLDIDDALGGLERGGDGDRGDRERSPEGADDD